MNNTLLVQVKNNYGSEVIYPICNNSRLIAKLAGTKTITDDAVKILKLLGYSFNQVSKEI